MNISENAPTYNLKVMVRETGLKPHTLRAWERRYGLPQPARTEGGHRIYSQRDIETVRWLVARQKEGMAISRAVELWLNLEEKGQDPLSVGAYRLEENAVTTEVGSALAKIRQEWIDSSLNFDESQAEDVLVQAFSVFPVKMVCVEVLQKGLAQIGELWYQNKATVQQEHFASALTNQRLDALLSAAPAPTRIGRILVACPPREEHAIPLLLLNLLLRYRGWEVIYLGANVPIVRLEKTVGIIKPDLVILAAQQLRTAATLLKTARILRDEDVNLAFGGRIFNQLPTLYERIPGYFLGKDLEDAVQVVEQVLTFNPPAPPMKLPSEAYVRAAEFYVAQRPLIELTAWQELEASDIPYEYVTDTTARLSENILAALYLGDINYIETEMQWGSQLLQNYDLPLDWTQHYFSAYYAAAHKHMDGVGQPILEWLDKARTKTYTA